MDLLSLLCFILMLMCLVSHIYLQGLSGEDRSGGNCATSGLSGESGERKQLPLLFMASFLVALQGPHTLHPFHLCQVVLLMASQSQMRIPIPVALLSTLFLPT